MAHGPLVLNEYFHFLNFSGKNEDESYSTAVNTTEHAGNSKEVRS